MVLIVEFGFGRALIACITSKPVLKVWFCAMPRAPSVTSEASTIKTTFFMIDLLNIGFFWCVFEVVTPQSAALETSTFFLIGSRKNCKLMAGKSVKLEIPTARTVKTII
jgi:hypothetical protein